MKHLHGIPQPQIAGGHLQQVAIRHFFLTAQPRPPRAAGLAHMRKTLLHLFTALPLQMLATSATRAGGSGIRVA